MGCRCWVPFWGAWSNEVYRDCLNHVILGMVAFLENAEKLIDSYQQAIACKSKPRAILCDRGCSAGELPFNPKPKLIRQEKGQYTYNWFLAEYMTVPLTRKSRVRARPYKSAIKEEKIQQYRRSISN